MYDPRVIPKDTFKVLLLYLQGLRVVFNIVGYLQGMSKIDVLESARAFDKTLTVTDKKDAKSVMDRIQKKRVTTIIEMLNCDVFSKQDTKIRNHNNGP